MSSAPIANSGQSAGPNPATLKYLVVFLSISSRFFFKLVVYYIICGEKVIWNSRRILLYTITMKEHDKLYCYFYQKRFILMVFFKFFKFK